jgi:phosphopantetheine--protein transferase-like protein
MVKVASFVAAMEGEHGTLFLERLFDRQEIEQCDSANPLVRARSLAGRFAVKEAVIKASKGELCMADLMYIHIRKDIAGFLEVFVDKSGTSCTRYEVSMSHDGDYAIGSAIKNP